MSNVKIEEVNDSDEEEEVKEQEKTEGESDTTSQEKQEGTQTDEEPPKLEPVQPQKKKESRSEKKAKQAILKLGLKPVPDCFRVTIKKGKDVFFQISDPEVYRNNSDNTYVIFGEAKMDDMGKGGQMDWSGLTDEFNDLEGNEEGEPNDDEPPQLIEVTDLPPETKPKEGETPKETTTTTTEPKKDSEFGVQTKYIDIILGQLNQKMKEKVSREQVAEALRTNNNDIVNAILSLENLVEGEETKPKEGETKV